MAVGDRSTIMDLSMIPSHWQTTSQRSENQIKSLECNEEQNLYDER